MGCQSKESSMTSKSSSYLIVTLEDLVTGHSDQLDCNMADKETDFSKLCKMKHERKIKLREYMKTPAWICENHNDVLFYIHRAIGSRHLPFEGITLLHFDSHPDLTVPPKMRSETVFHQEKLYDEISIADWILPAVYAGHINRVIWIKPPWSNQIKEGTFKFIVGRHKETGFVRCCSALLFNLCKPLRRVLRK